MRPRSPRRRSRRRLLRLRPSRTKARVAGRRNRQGASDSTLVAVGLEGRCPAQRQRRDAGGPRSLTSGLRRWQRGLTGYRIAAGAGHAPHSRHQFPYGGSLPKGFDPSTFGFYEALHLASTFMSRVEEHLAEHPAVSVQSSVRDFGRDSRNGAGRPPLRDQRDTPRPRLATVCPCETWHEHFARHSREGSPSHPLEDSTGQNATLCATRTEVP